MLHGLESKRFRLSCSVLALLLLVITQSQVKAIEPDSPSIPAISLTSTSYTFYPLAGYTSVTVTGNEFGDGDDPPMTVGWTTFTHFVTTVWDNSGKVLVNGKPNQLGGDTIFKFQMNYTGTCVSGTYSLVFSDKNSYGTGYATFVATVHCSYGP